jgi:carbamoyltransferase
MRILATYMGHESTITIYDNGKITTIELDKLTGEKWFRGANTPYAELANILEEAFEYTGGNKFDVWINGSFDHAKFNGQVWHQRFGRIVDAKRVIHGPGHHLLHAYCGLYQSPFDKALIFSSDGGGNDGNFNIYRADKKTGISLFENIDRFDFATTYGLLGSLSPEIKEQHDFLNIAGKAMGLAAFYTPPRPLTDLDKGIRDDVAAAYSGQGTKRFFKYFPELGRPKDWKANNVGVSRTKGLIQIGDELAARRLLYWNQYTLDHKMQAILDDRQYEVYSRYDAQIILVGGVALNVTTNEYLKQDGYNTFVPCNPSDRGLSLGMIYWYLYLTGMDIPEGSQHFSGMPLIKDKVQKTKRKASIKSIAKLLREGAIIGVAEGTNEIGQRALGRRSIICDPSIPDMKDRINTQVKFREQYRPFAPILLEEHLHYLDTVHTDNLEFMSYGMKTTEEFQELYPSVCHVDGTARAQLCTDTNSTVYKLMKELGTPLLNTSFNIQGQPIIARESEAFIMLEQGGLDAILLEGVLYKKPPDDK